jgi:uncharacterized membrane protein (UPF0127 family)
MKIKINNKIEIEVKKCNETGKFFGLMFTPRKRAKILLFDFKKPSRTAIHSFYVFFPFLAVWLDDKNRINEIRKVFPFTLYVRPKKPFYRLIEIPITERYKEIVKSFSYSKK